LLARRSYLRKPFLGHSLVDAFKTEMGDQDDAKGSVALRRLKIVRLVCVPLVVLSRPKRRPLGATLDSRNVGPDRPSRRGAPWIARRWNIDYVEITSGEHNAV
jgi:hypothetical protein